MLGLKGIRSINIVRMAESRLIRYTGDDDDVTVFANKARSDKVPGLPELDPRRVVRRDSKGSM